MKMWVDECVDVYLSLSLWKSRLFTCRFLSHTHTRTRRALFFVLTNDNFSINFICSRLSLQFYSSHTHSFALLSARKCTRNLFYIHSRCVYLLLHLIVGNQKKKKKIVKSAKLTEKKLQHGQQICQPARQPTKPLKQQKETVLKSFESNQKRKIHTTSTAAAINNKKNLKANQNIIGKRAFHIFNNQQQHQTPKKYCQVNTHTHTHSCTYIQTVHCTMYILCT